MMTHVFQALTNWNHFLGIQMNGRVSSAPAALPMTCLTILDAADLGVLNRLDNTYQSLLVTEITYHSNEA